MCLIGNLMGESNVPVLFQSTIMFFCFQTTLLTLRTAHWTKKGAVQQVHADVTAENQWNLDHHGIRRSSCKTRQVTMVSVEIISPKEAPDLSEIFQPSSLKLNCVTANSVEEY